MNKDSFIKDFKSCCESTSFFSGNNDVANAVLDKQRKNAAEAMIHRRYIQVDNFLAWLNDRTDEFCYEDEDGDIIMTLEMLATALSEYLKE